MKLSEIKKLLSDFKPHTILSEDFGDELTYYYICVDDKEIRDRAKIFLEGQGFHICLTTETSLTITGDKSCVC